MKKFYLSVAVALCSLASMATDYTGTINIAVNGSATQQANASISLDDNSGNYNFLLKNFTYQVGGVTKNIGNVAINAIPAFAAGNKTLFYASANVNITAGDAAGVSAWEGPTLGAVPVKVVGRIQDNYVAIDLEMQLQDAVAAQFSNVGDHFQIPNSDFEGWAASSGEPDHWHGFKSAYGGLEGWAQGKLGSSTDVRPGTTGTKSALITAGSVFGIVNNGTMTNGRLKAANMSASNTDNHSEMDIASEETDKNGDPFYTALYAAPDAIQLWLKCNQASNQYANVSAIAFDGTYYQDPEDKTYTNVAAKAQNKQVQTGGWRLLNIPFDYASYASNNAAAQAILVTFSTNSTAGGGASGDKVWIDDLELVYNAGVTGFTCKGATVEGFAPAIHEYSFTWEDETAPVASDYALAVDGKSAVTAVNVEETENGYRVVAMAVSGDLMTANAYVINYEVPVVVKYGDVNGDGEVNVNDVTVLINYILGKNPTPFIAANADVNQDTSINVNDVTALINMILGGN